jgi:hypothetical protein
MNLLPGLIRRCWTSYTTAASRVTFVSVSDLLLTWSVFGSRFRNNHIEQTMELDFKFDIAIFHFIPASELYPKTNPEMCPLPTHTKASAPPKSYNTQ